MDGFRRRLADAIDERGWSARELSARAGLAEGHVSMMLGGKYAGKRPTMESVTALAHALGVSLEWLASGKGTPEFAEYSALPPRPKRPKPLPPENASLTDARESAIAEVLADYPDDAYVNEAIAEVRTMQFRTKRELDKAWFVRAILRHATELRALPK